MFFNTWLYLHVFLFCDWSFWRACTLSKETYYFHFNSPLISQRWYRVLRGFVQHLSGSYTTVRVARSICASWAFLVSCLHAV